jgi:signal transduction histidine kinase
MREKQFRQQYIVEPELQFWFVLIIIFIVLIEGIFISWGISRLSTIVSDWKQSNMAMDFFKTLILILLLLIGGNFLLGIYLSHKVAGPLFRVRKALQEIRKGNFCNIQLRRGSMLKDFVKEFNETMLVLNKLIHRDQKIINGVLEQLSQCDGVLKKKHSIKELEEVQKKILLIKSSLVTVNSHFRLSTPLFEKEKDNGK